MYEVRIGDQFAQEVADRWGPERSASGRPSEVDFWSGPLVAARLAFRDFDELPIDLIPEARLLHHFDRVFGPLLFTGLLVEPQVVELISVTNDPEYWSFPEVDTDD